MSTWKVRRDIANSDREDIAVEDAEVRNGILYVAAKSIGHVVAVVNDWGDTDDEEQRTLGYDFEALIALECPPEVRQGLERLPAREVDRPFGATQPARRC